MRRTIVAVKVRAHPLRHVRSAAAVHVTAGDAATAAAVIVLQAGGAKKERRGRRRSRAQADEQNRTEQNRIPKREGSKNAFFFVQKNVVHTLSHWHVVVWHRRRAVALRPVRMQALCVDATKRNKTQKKNQNKTKKVAHTLTAPEQFQPPLGAGAPASNGGSTFSSSQLPCAQNDTMVKTHAACNAQTQDTYLTDVGHPHFVCLAVKREPDKRKRKKKRAY